MESEGLDNKPLNAIVIGGSGAVGRYLIHELADNPEYSKIISVGRRVSDDPFLNPENGKVEQLVVDMDTMDSISEKFGGNDIAFCCIGTTRSNAGSAEEFYKVDHDYVVNFARLSKNAGVEDFQVVSSVSSNPNSWFLYLKTKGEMEEHCKEIGFRKLTIYQPGLLKRDKPRFIERLASLILPTMPTSTLGTVMGRLAANDFRNKRSGVEIVSNNKIYEYFKTLLRK